MADVSDAYETLDGFFRDRAASDGTMAINFITYFESREVFNQAFEELSLTQIRDGSLHLPEGISATAQLVADKGNIALLFFVGRFTKVQAKEVVSVFSKYAYKKGNDEYLPETATSFASKLEGKGGGGIVWIEWDYEGR